MEQSLPENTIAYFDRCLPRADRIVPLLGFAALLAGNLAEETRGQGLREVNSPAAPEKRRVIALTDGRLINGRDAQPLENAVILNGSP